MKQIKKLFQKKAYWTALFSCVLLLGVFAAIDRFGVKTVPQQKPNQTASSKTQFQNEQKQKQPQEQEPEQTVQAVKPTTQPLPQNTPKKTDEAAPAKPSAQKPSDDTDLEMVSSMDQGMLNLAWPINGTIVMDYNIDNAIYDITLEQYRTNDCISIAAEKGAKVQAAGNGIVKNIEHTATGGTSITLEHNDGWKTTYSQLAEDVTVAVGDTVASGQVIGHVGTPSQFSVLLGDHIDFQVAREDATIDPKVALAKQ